VVAWRAGMSPHSAGRNSKVIGNTVSIMGSTADKYLGLVAGLEILFPVVRSEVIASGLDPAPLRGLLDRYASSRRIWDELPAAVSRSGIGTMGAAGRLFQELVEGVESPPTVAHAVAAIETMARVRAGSLANELRAPNGDSPSIERRLVSLTADLADKAWTVAEMRTHCALVGRDLEERLFIIDADRAGPAVRVAVELDAATRLLTWYERFDVRESRGNGVLLCEALSTGWDVLRGVDRSRQAADLDAALQRAFVNTDRYPVGDWVAWLASRAVDAVYSAVGLAFGKAPWPSAVDDARTAAVEVAMIARGLDPWNLEGTYRTLVDDPVLAEVRAQLNALGIARQDPLFLAEATA
jgi:hypothetical protein